MNQRNKKPIIPQIENNQNETLKFQLTRSITGSQATRGFEKLTEKQISNVVCFSHLRWNFVFQRPQHLLTRWARDVNVYYFEGND